MADDDDDGPPLEAIGLLLFRQASDDQPVPAAEPAPPRPPQWGRSRSMAAQPAPKVDPPPAMGRRVRSAALSGVPLHARKTVERAARRWAREARRQVKLRRHRLLQEAHAAEAAADAAFGRAAAERLRERGQLPVRDAERAAASQTFLLAERFIVYVRTGDALRLERALRQEDMARGMCVINRFEPLPPRALRQLRASLSEGAVRVLEEPNAGGSSENSEAISLAMLETCFGATLVKTEMGMRYVREASKKIDYLARVAGRRVGVSVTRAMRFRGVFTAADARRLLFKKLQGLLEAREGVCSADRWDVDLLHCWAQNDAVAAVVATVYDELPASVTADTVVLLTTSSHIDHVLFRNTRSFSPPAPARGAAGAGVEPPPSPKVRRERVRRDERSKWRAMLPLAAKPPPEVPERLRYFLS